MSTRPQEHLEAMLKLLNGHCIEQALHVVAVLGIADQLYECSQSACTLAAKVHVDPQALDRVLALLSAIDVFSKSEDGNYSLTDMGTTLRSDVHNSVRDRAMFYGSTEMWKAWGQLMHSVETGNSAFAHAHDVGFYEFLSNTPDIAAPFNRYMTTTSAQQMAALLDAYDFSQFSSIADIGGGQGGTLAVILRSAPKLNGILFDLPAVISSAGTIEEPAVSTRVTRVAGNMDEFVPRDCDAYLIKWVMMDRPDDAVVRLLDHCRKAMREGGKVLVVEIVLPVGRPPAFAALLDVQMMLLSGRARLRNAHEWQSLFEKAGLPVARFIDTHSPNTIIEGSYR